ncbi:MAG TPA: dynamin family protein [Terriglobia bacterium]|nr:dynamin family protein [Terriglobia bacterium]
MEEQPRPPEPAETLRQYDRLKAEIASATQSAFYLLDAEKAHDEKRACQDLLARLADDRFVLAVLGQFNRGKSSLMNAVLGMDRLPVGVVPLTSAITKVFYGNPERVRIEYQGTSLRTEITLSQLPNYVTETGNPGNSKKVAAAEIQLPSDVLRYGFYFVDTPGIGSAITANTETTERFLPEADAVIFVTSFESPLTREEVEFLGKVRDHVRKIFLVINKSDLVPVSERDRVLTFIRGVLQAELGISEARLFAVSAQGGLVAKVERSERKLAESGLPQLEESLVQFLTRERVAESLARVCDRAVALLSEVQAGDAVAEKDAPKLRDLNMRLAQIRQELLGSDSVAARATEPFRSKKTFSSAELLEAVRKPCPVCVRVADAMMKFLAGFQYRVLVDQPDRAANARRGGLCPLHTWQYSEIASPQGVSAAYPPVLNTMSRRLEALAALDSPDPASRTGSLVVHPKVCRICQEQAKVQDTVLTEILESLSNPNGKNRRKLPALCLPHLAALLGKQPDGSLRAELLSFEAALLDRLAENMQRYGLKHDALRRGFASEDERIAYYRGLSYLVGDKRLSFPWHIEHIF